MVRGGHILIDEATDLPEGTVLHLVSADDVDALEAEERDRLHAALAASEEDVAAGDVVPADRLIAELRRSDR